MKFILFCQNPYAFGILEPIMQVLKEKNYDYLWFLPPNLSEKFPFQEEPHTFDIDELIAFKSDAILCPGNEVPYYLRGLKVQIFHGLAGEKKGHFRIRHYFDLYLTQGPYFTEKFKQLKRKYKNFEVIETGWPKLDIYGKDSEKYKSEKEELLENFNASAIVLYAPTFSPSLTSAPFLLKEIERLAENKNYLVLIKFHDLMAPETISQYKELAGKIDNLIVEEEPNIVKFLLMADIMISDTSSVVYEFLLLNKPVITYRNNSKTILWDNATEYRELPEKVISNLEKDEYREQRLKVIENYHPYNDGNSALRMVEAIENYISAHGVPEKRKLSFLRRRKINSMFKSKKN
ncbi:CDP-glycerol glycerophosphotransferase family protein [Christiangramia sediminis]|uniref:CDP-glycerol glycerophosphotransferase family protein n=1 Tax=Christiangramia sediminis TaxID=2881336 RepID=A0A9X1RWM9_9FLAO|nr:CDP-glycerol glycerophosphotransferase family protein [Christiangramia sediminis]MCB7480846.1 CDP-glycerol glycerophosphotransferase family protein [Christiangramia sediminis]